MLDSSPQDAQGKLVALIGGSPRSGSTLVSALLNAHPRFMCAADLNLFAHPAFWTGDHQRVASQQMAGDGMLSWAASSAASLEFCLHTMSDIRSAAAEIREPIEFAEFILADRGIIEGADGFIEKTSANVFAMDSALSRYPNLKAIVTIRAGADAIYSLIKTKTTARMAVAQWIVHATLVQLLAKRYGPERVHVIRYEDLVTSPAETYSKALSFLDLNSEGGVVAERHKLEAADALSSVAPVLPASIGSSGGRLSNRLVDYLMSCRVKKNALAPYGFPDRYLTGAQLTSNFGYDLPPRISDSSRLLPAEAVVATDKVTKFYVPLVEDRRDPKFVKPQTAEGPGKAEEKKIKKKRTFKEKWARRFKRLAGL